MAREGHRKEKRSIPGGGPRSLSQQSRTELAAKRHDVAAPGSVLAAVPKLTTSCPASATGWHSSKEFVNNIFPLTFTFRILDLG